MIVIAITTVNYTTNSFHNVRMHLLVLITLFVFVFSMYNAHLILCDGVFSLVIEIWYVIVLITMVKLLQNVSETKNLVKKKDSRMVTHQSIDYKEN